MVGREEEHRIARSQNDADLPVRMPRQRYDAHVTQLAEPAARRERTVGLGLEIVEGGLEVDGQESGWYRTFPRNVEAISYSGRCTSTSGSSAAYEYWDSVVALQ